MVSGAAAMFTVTPAVAPANVYGYSILLGAGTGMVFNAGYTVGGVKTMIRTGSGLDVQRAISMLNLSQLGFQMGSLLIGGQIFQSYARSFLIQALSSAGTFSSAQINDIIAGSHSALFDSLSEESQRAATAAITQAIGRVYILSITAGAVVAVCGALMKKEMLFPASGLPTIAAGGP